MSVCAAVVTYQPNIAELASNLVKLRPQVDMIVVIDNASREPLRESLRALTAKYDCHFIENPENLGIAEALNQGVRFAISRQATFVLFFDQDSGTSADFVAQEMACFEVSSHSDRVGLVMPTILKRSDLTRLPPVRLRNGSIILAQTSGALMPVSVFKEVGLFRSDMFIDYVDYEHCLRMAAKGWRIAYAETAELDHMPGNGKPFRFLGRTLYTVDALPLRHYYETRNCLWVFRHYVGSSPEMATRLLLRMLYVRLQAILFESDRRAKLGAILEGSWDALRGHMGKRRPSASA